LMSYFEFGVNSGWFHDTNEKWEWFAKSKYLFYRQWMCKWQAIAYLNGFPFINYGKLIRSPAHTLMDVLHYFGEDPKWDDVMNAVSQPVAAPTLGYYHRNKSTREIKEFKHYDRRFLQRIGLLTAK